MWLEQPVPAENIDAYKRIPGSKSTPICAGENVYLACYVPFAPHMVSSYLAAMASEHVCASAPNFMILEWQTYFHTDPMFKEIVTYEGEMIEDRFQPVSDKPGTGVGVNEEALRKYAVEGMPFFE